jgi:hypothetical protein
VSCPVIAVKLRQVGQYNDDIQAFENLVLALTALKKKDKILKEDIMIIYLTTSPLLKNNYS